MIWIVDMCSYFLRPVDMFLISGKFLKPCATHHIYPAGTPTVAARVDSPLEGDLRSWQKPPNSNQLRNINESSKDFQGIVTDDFSHLNIRGHP